MRPDKLEQCINQLVETLVCRLDIDMSSEDLDRIALLYKITISYCLITADLNRYPALIDDSNILNVVVNTLVNDNLLLKLNRKFVPYLKNLISQLKMSYEFNNFNDSVRLDLYIHLSKLHFNHSMFYQAICIVHDSFFMETELQDTFYSVI